MSMLTLFEFDTPAWAPVFHPHGPWEARGESATDATKDEWEAYRRAQRCRDCGRVLAKCSRTHSCGGGESGNIYDLCDDCAALDGCEARALRHLEEIPAGEHVSQWGIRTTDEEHARLTESQAIRRTKYLREVAS